MDALFPSLPELVSRARGDLRLGLPVVIEDGETRALVASAEALSAQRLATLVADGTAELALTHRRAETLKMRLYDGDLVRLPLSPDLRPADLQAMIDPAEDLSTPMKGPFNARREGSATLARAGLALAKSARILPAVVVRPVANVPAMLTRLPIDAIAPQTPARLESVINARLPIAASVETRLHVFRPDDGTEEHYAVEIGRPDHSKPVLTQLNTALEAMAAAGSGILLYLNQEGRGIGLANKMRAYALQDQGFDTVEANHRLGFDDDERDFGLGVALLREMGVGRVRLMTNNPRKVTQLQAEGIDVVERVPLWVGETRYNRDYLRIKSEKSGHMT